MKSLILLSIVFVFVSCDGAGVSANKSDCYYNGEKVSCDALKSSPAPKRRLEQEVTLKAQVSSEISTDGRRITVLENQEDVQTESAEGYHLSCEVFTKAGDSFTWTLQGNTLLLSRNGENNSYNRVSGSGSDLIGKWVSYESDDEMSGSVTLEFTPRRLSITSTCTFR